MARVSVSSAANQGRSLSNEEQLAEKELARLNNVLTLVSTIRAKKYELAALEAQLDKLVQ